MTVYKLVNFNGRLVRTKGTVVGTVNDCYVVDFVHQDVKFRGLWDIIDCSI